MTKQDLKEKYPVVYAEILNEGIQQERQRQLQEINLLTTKN